MRTLILDLRNEKDLGKRARHLAEICKQNNGQIIPLVPYKQILQETRENDHWETNIKD